MSDINECERLPSPCLNNGSGSVTCENTYGSYNCLVVNPKPPIGAATIGMFIEKSTLFKFFFQNLVSK